MAPQLHSADRSLASLSSIGQRLREELSRIADPDVQVSLSSASATQQNTDSTLTDLGSPTTFGGRFRILRPDSLGGLGERRCTRGQARTP